MVKSIDETIKYYEKTFGFGPFEIRQVDCPHAAYYMEDYLEAKRTSDTDARNALLKELSVRMIDDVVPGIPLGTPYDLVCKWPWVKNWYGEVEESAWGSGRINARIWIDQDLKALLGY